MANSALKMGTSIGHMEHEVWNEKNCIQTDDARKKAKEILVKQLEMLSEESEKKNTPEGLVNLSMAMANIAQSVARLEEY